jgi:excisionase family DNA binding protein
MRVINISQAAEILGVTRSEIPKLVSKGLLEYVFDGRWPNKRLVREKDVYRLLHSGKVEPKRDPKADAELHRWMVRTFPSLYKNR